MGEKATWIQKDIGKKGRFCVKQAIIAWNKRLLRKTFHYMK